MSKNRSDFLEQISSSEPVSSVAEALGLLFDLRVSQPKKNPPPAKAKNPLLKNALLLVLVCFTAFLIARIHGWTPFGNEVSPPGNDLTQTGLSGGVSDVKNPVIAEGKSTESLTEPEPVSGPQIKISLSGKPGIALSLAQLTTEKLEKLLTKKITANPQNISISGQIVIRNISEMPPDKEGALTTLMTVAVNGLTFGDSKTTRSLPVFSITVQGKGSVKTLGRRGRC